MDLSCNPVHVQMLFSDIQGYFICGALRALQNAVLDAWASRKLLTSIPRSATVQGHACYSLKTVKKDNSSSTTPKWTMY